MYYYIFEPTKNPKEMKVQDEIKITLQNLGIVGEFVTLSLAEEPRDLARVGLRKNYSTIVAVGSDRLINEIAMGLIESPAVLGAIPTDEGSDFHRILGTKNYIEACQIMPARKVITLDTALINQEKIFITKIIIKPKRELSLSENGLIIVNFDGHFAAETKLCEITVSNIGTKKEDTEKTRELMSDEHLDIFIPDQLKERRGIFARIFGKEEKIKAPKTGSVFHPRRVSIESRKKLIAMLYDKIIARGNMLIESYPASLRLIIKRERPQIEVEEEG